MDLKKPESGQRSSDTNEPIEIAVRSVRKHWLLGSIVVICVVTATLFYTIGQKKIYRATATVQVDPTPPRPLGKDVQGVVDMGAGSYWSNKEYAVTQLELLRGRGVAEETVRVLSLHRDAAFLSNTPVGLTPKPTKAFPTPAETAGVLLSRLRVEPIKDSRLVVANLDDASPERARRILSTLLDVYLERNINQTVSATAAASKWLLGQTETLKEELEKAELALHEYKKEKRILSVSLDDQSNMLRGEIQQLVEAMTRVNGRRQDLLARVRQLDKVDPNNPTELPSSELLASGILTNLRQDYSRTQGEYESLLGEGKGENYPDVDAVRARTETTRKALLAEIKNVQGALRNDLTSATQEAAGIGNLLERAKQQALDLNMLEIEYRRLERSKDNTEKLFGLVLERSKESDLTGLMRFNNIMVAEQPIAGSNPVRPNVPLNLAIGLGLGLMLGFAAAFGREWFDRTIRGPEEVEATVGAPLLGLLPSLFGNATQSSYYSRQSHRRNVAAEASRADDSPIELMVHALPASNAAECARGIRTSLMFASPDKPYRTILVTSGSPSEGKTMVASTIAIAFAQANQKVLLVDCDLRRARLHRVFKCRNATGVTSALQDPTGLDATIVATGVPNLSLLPAGPYVPNPAELLQSDSFVRLLESLQQRFDRIIVDSPPVMLVTDAVVLGSRVDATVVVLRARKTRRDVAQQAARKLTDIGATLAGVVLNAMDATKQRGGYYYGYYSRDTYGAGADTNASR